MKETSPSPHTGSEPFTPTVGVKNRYSVLARGRFSPARLAKAPTLGSGARVDSQTALCRAGTAAIPVVFVGFPPGVRRSERRYLGANRSDCARLPRFHAWIARKIVPGLTHDSTSDSTSRKRLYQRAQKCRLQARRGGRAGAKLTQQEKPFSSPVEDNFRIDVSCGDSGPVAPLCRSAGPPGFVPPALAAVADARTRRWPEPCSHSILSRCAVSRGKSRGFEPHRVRSLGSNSDRGVLPCGNGRDDPQ